MFNLGERGEFIAPGADGLALDSGGGGNDGVTNSKRKEGREGDDLAGGEIAAEDRPASGTAFLPAGAAGEPASGPKTFGGGVDVGGSAAGAARPRGIVETQEKPQTGGVI